MPHAHDRNGIVPAVKAGLISIHAGEFVDDEGLELLVESRCIFLPTAAWLKFRVKEEYAAAYLRSGEIDAGRIQAFQDDCKRRYEAAQKAIVKAFEKGVRLGIWSDGAHVFPPYNVTAELEAIQQLGIPAMAVLKAATAISSESVARGERWGTLTAGKEADLLVVADNPAEDVRKLSQPNGIRAVIQDGRLMHGVHPGVSTTRSTPNSPSRADKGPLSKAGRRGQVEKEPVASLA